MKGASLMVKRVIDTDESSGFEAMLGEKVCVFCGIYIYTGILTAVDDASIELDPAQIVYDTGDLKTGGWKDAQEVPGPWHIMRMAIESWGLAKC
jgi:hypothetical protein